MSYDKHIFHKLKIKTQDKIKTQTPQRREGIRKGSIKWALCTFCVCV